MSDPRFEDDLKQFLDWHATEARKGYTIANMMARQEQFFGVMKHLFEGHSEQIRNLNARVSESESNVEEMRRTVDEHGYALVAIKRRIRTGPNDQEMDTGVHQLAAIQARLAEHEQRRRDSERAKAEDVVWWKRSIIGWVAGAVGVIITSLVTVLITLAIANSRPAQAAPPPPTITSPR